MKNISILELKKILDSDDFKNHKVVVVDVRTKLEYEGGHIEGAINRPLDDIEQYKDELSKYETIYMHCRTGIRSAKACGSLENIGLSNVVTLDGGIQAWENDGNTVIKNKEVISLFRQILISAGSLVTLGLILTYTIHPAFIVITAFVGLGLIYSGITDNCMLGKILSKMPWNK